jgi:hypothetical protein
MCTTTSTKYLILQDIDSRHSVRNDIKRLAAGEVVTYKEFYEFFEGHLAAQCKGYYRDPDGEYCYALCLKTKRLISVLISSVNVGRNGFPLALRIKDEWGAELGHEVIEHAQMINSIVVPILHVSVSQLPKLVATKGLNPVATTLVKARIEGIL